MVELECDRRQPPRRRVVLALLVGLDAGDVRDQKRGHAGDDQGRHGGERDPGRQAERAQARPQELRQRRSVVGLCCGRVVHVAGRGCRARPRLGGPVRFAQSFTMTITAEIRTQITIRTCTTIQKPGMG